jgi:predicted small metal-binding protein
MELASLFKSSFAGRGIRRSGRPQRVLRASFDHPPQAEGSSSRIRSSRFLLFVLWISERIALEEKSMAQDFSKGPSSERNTGQGNQKLNFRCSDVGPKSCNWQVSGQSEDEILPKIEQHGREAHNLTMDENTRSKVRNAIRPQAA